MGLATKVNEMLIEGAKQLQGFARRPFMARAVEALVPRGWRRAQRELGRDRETIRKGLHEFRTGVEFIDGRCASGVKSDDTNCGRTCAGT